MKARIAVGGFALGVATTVASLLTIGHGPWASPVPVLGQAHFQEAREALLARYVRPIDESALWAGAIRGMLTSLDPYCHFVSAAERKALRMRRDGGATGIAVALRRGRLEVTAVLPDSPGAKAGVAPGDLVVRVDGTTPAAFTSQQAAELAFVGPVGRAIELTIASRQGDVERDLVLELATVRASPVESAIVSDASGRRFVHVVIRTFSRDVAAAALRELSRRTHALGDDLAGVVLDVRGNPGGEIDEALVIADRFVERGVLVRTRGRDGKLLREELAHGKGTDGKTPLVVLQDRYSASASELLAAALQDHRRAMIVGERSFGKGTVQEVLGLADGSAVTFTIARYHSPSDRVVDGEGVIPDVTAQLVPTTPSAGVVDAGLQAALDAFAFVI